MTKKNTCKAYLILILFVLTTVFSSIADAAISSSERTALIALYNSTNGDHWTNKSGWKTSPIYSDGFSMPGTENSWYGVTCNSENTDVLEIYLSENNLTGTIPVEFGNLSSLQKIDLFSNQLTGSIPAELGNLKNLQRLILELNQLTGPIPVELGNLANLQVLDLVLNNLTGSIPIQLSNLANLTSLSLSCNGLTGTIPAQLGNLTKLRGFYIHDNQLTGTIPPELGNLVNLQYLYLHNNQLTGSIPAVLGNLTSLIRLQLQSNKLDGAIPPELGNLVNLQYLQLQGNQLTGSVPATFLNLFVLFEDLNLNYNSLYAENEELLLFLNDKNPGWISTQTIHPDNVTVKAVSTNSILLGWSPILYNGGSGGYVVSYRAAPDGPYIVFGTTTNKNINHMEVTGLNQDKSYYFVVQSKTELHENNKNIVLSGYSMEVSAQTEMDSDGDGLSDNLESTTCTDENNADTDNDGIPDGVEDTNKNGIVDTGETNPCDADTDDDGIPDGIEDTNHNGIVDQGETNPTKFDTDNDEMPDGWEIRYGLNPLANDAEEDPDDDGFSNKKEYQRRTDPTDYNSQPSKDLPWLLLLLGDD